MQSKIFGSETLSSVYPLTTSRPQFSYKRFTAWVVNLLFENDPMLFRG
jgi:hypothetical protein